ncbi:MAG: nodulation protein NfeD [Pseudomonadales bacterium]
MQPSRWPVVALALALTWAAQAQAKDVWVLEVEGAIGPASADFIVRNLEDAQDQHAALFVIRLDTPGGLDKSMRDIIKAILASDIPVATYVAPEGSRAASAGTYILYASHIAAMAPATNLGAATPVSIGAPGLPAPQPTPTQPIPPPPAPEDPTSGEPAPPETGYEPATAMERKIINDAVAYIRGLAELRGRNAEWAEEAVRKGVSLSSSEALENNVIDLIAEGLRDLLEQADGREVKLDKTTMTVATANADIVRVQPDWRNEFLALITDPNVAAILMMIGIYGIILEFYNPGIGAAGITGLICLLIAAYAFQMLPISYVGLGLMFFGITLMVAEAFTPAFGVLGIGGVIAFVVGSIFLMDTELPAYQISLPVILGLAVASVAVFIFAIGFSVKAHTSKVVSGAEAIVGAHGVVLEDFEGENGHVRAFSENWSASSAQQLKQGDNVRVVAIDGLILTVEPED